MADFLSNALASAGSAVGGALQNAAGAAVGGSLKGAIESAPASGKSDPAQSSIARLLAGAKRRPDGSWTVPGSPPMSDAAFKALVERNVQVDLNYLSLDELKPILDKAGVQFSSAGGTFRVTGVPGAGGVSVAPPSTSSGLATTPAPAPTSTGSGGRSAGGGGGAFGPVGGSPAGRSSGGASWGGGGGGGAGGLNVQFPGGGQNGVTSIDPNKPLGLDPSKGGPAGFQAGSFGAPGTFASPGSILQGLGPNSSLNDVIMNIVKRQEGNRDSALATYGGALKTAETDPVLQGARGRAMDVLNNPFSLDDTTVSRILGSQADTIGQGFNRLKAQSAERAAAAGVGRGGDAASDALRLDVNAVKSLGDAQRGLLVEQATRKPKELQASLGAAGDFGARDVAQRTGIATGAADSIYGQTSILGDALLSGVLMGGQGPKVAVNAPYQGYLLGPNTQYQ